MTDKVWPALPTGPNEHPQRAEVEQQDAASLQTELDEQQRTSGETGGVFDFNRVEPVGEGSGGRVIPNSDHWGRK